MNKYKQYSYDSKGEIKYWYNPTRKKWEVFDCLKNDWVGFDFKKKIDAIKAAEYHYSNGLYAYAPDNSILARKDLSNFSMVSKNEKKFTKITRVDGVEMQWVGFGWI